jgi:transposase
MVCRLTLSRSGWRAAAEVDGGWGIDAADREIVAVAPQNDACRRLAEIPGVGLMIETALVAAIGDGVAFTKERDLAQNLFCKMGHGRGGGSGGQRAALSTGQSWCRWAAMRRASFLCSRRSSMFR